MTFDFLYEKPLADLPGGDQTFEFGLKKTIVEVFWGVQIEKNFYDLVRFDTFFEYV